MERVIFVLYFLIRASDSYNFHTPDGSSIGDGFDMALGRLAPAVSTDFPDCEEDDDEAVTCIATILDPKTLSYTETTSNSETRTATIETTTTIEGSGWGVTAGASVTYMHISEVSDTSVDMMLGAGVSTHNKMLKNPSMMNLTQPAKRLLGSNPALFLATYGSHYIQQIKYGASFIGSYHMEAKQQSDKDSVDVFAEFGASDVFYSADLSENFSIALRDASASVSTSNKISSAGGVNPVWGGGEPYDMMEVFTNWESGLTEDNTAVMSMTYQNWYELLDVQDTLEGQDQDVIEMFLVQIMTPIAIDSITKEVAQLQYLSNAVDGMKNWDCLNNYIWWDDAVYNFSTTVTAKLAMLEGISESGALDIQTQIQAGDTTWQSYHTLHKQFLELEEQHIENCAITYSNCTYVSGWDYGGGGGYLMDATGNPTVLQLSWDVPGDETTCCEECLAHQGCAAFTFVTDQFVTTVQYFRGTCWLMGSSYYESVMENMISGTVF